MGTLHRLVAPAQVSPPALSDRELELSLIVPLVVLWAASVARVYAAVSAREVFGVEASLAFICLFLLPWLGTRAWWQRRARRTGCHTVVHLSSLSRRRRGLTPQRSCGDGTKENTRDQIA